jgi:hypothetical protein
MLQGKTLGEFKHAMHSCATLAVLDRDEGELGWQDRLIAVLGRFMGAEGGEVCTKPSPDGRYVAVGFKRRLTDQQRAKVDAYLEGFRDAMVPAVRMSAAWEQQLQTCEWRLDACREREKKTIEDRPEGPTRVSPRG